MSSTSGTHPSLIGRAQDRDQDAWARLVSIYTPLVLGWCKGFGCDSHTSQDIAQETFLAASRSIGSLRRDGQTGSFRRWLWQIAKNKLIDFRRRYPASMLPPGGSTAAMNLHQIAAVDVLSDSDPSSPDMLRDLLLNALALVRVEFKEMSWNAFWRSSIDGLPTDVVAAELGITAAAVRQSRSRIMRRLRVELGDHGFEQRHRDG